MPDTLTPSISIDDAILKKIIKRLYYPESPYEFSVISPVILGQVYEQFLGKVIRLTAGHQAKVEYKPEVKKAGGVYYTPQYIVDYIVSHTVGELVKDKTPREVGKLRILDPACGSGSFLLGAYQFLLDWHLNWYIHNLVPVIAEKSATSPEVLALLPEPVPKTGKKKFTGDTSLPIYKSANGSASRTRSDWKLTIAERKRILLNNIYGVDIDTQAVEVTKLSLLLKVLEEESQENVSKQLKLFDERALPSLHQNIKCGNSLIGTDIYTDMLLPLDDPEVVKRINPFDWKREFSDTMKAGGFDVVIGNPPYLRQEALREQKKYFETHYEVYQGTADLYAYFIEKGLSLSRPKGQFSYIVANKWMRANYGKPLRKFLLTKQIEEIVDFGDLPVFTTAITYPCIIRISNEKPSREFVASKVKALDFSSLHEYVKANQHLISPGSLSDQNGWTLGDLGTESLLMKLNNIGQSLDKYLNGQVFYGIKTGLNKAFVIDEKIKKRLIEEDPKSVEFIKSFVVGKDIKRYSSLKSQQYLILVQNGWTNSHSGDVKNKWKWFKEHFPAISNHLEPFATQGETRDDKGEYWWELRPCVYYLEFEKPKIIYPEICQKPEFTFDEKKFYANNKCFIIPSSDKYLLGILNSKLNYFLFEAYLPKLQAGFFMPAYIVLKNFPIRTINFTDPTDKARHDKMVSMVERMLALNKQKADVKIDHEKNLVERQIEATDKQIDALVYELYGLTEEEIKIVEESLK